MPCTITIAPREQLLGPYEDVGLLRRALADMGFTVTESGQILHRGSTIGTVRADGTVSTIEYNKTHFTRLPQRVAARKAVEAARRKGYKVQQQEQADGTVLVTVTR